MSRLARKTGLTREGLYKALSPGGNPEFATVMKVIRARCVVVLVSSPELFEPECRTPDQMRAANAVCRHREVASVVSDG